MYDKRRLPFIIMLDVNVPVVKFTIFLRNVKPIKYPNDKLSG